MHPDIQAFLSGLFQSYTTAGQAAFITFSAIHPGGCYATPSRHVQLSNTHQLEQAVEDILQANRLGWGAYIGVAPRKTNLGRWARGGKSDLLGLPAVFVDIDQPSGALDKLHEFDPLPSCIVRSGYGYHAYFFLDKPTLFLHTAERVLHGLAKRLGGDSITSSAQSLRLVGSLNTKSQQYAPCELLELHADRRYDLARFTTYMTPLPPALTTTTSRYLDDTSVLTAIQKRELGQAIAASLMQDYEGFSRRSGWLAARCIYPHAHDRPGMHFTFRPDSCIAHCFGKHGVISLPELCSRFGLSLPDRHS